MAAITIRNLPDDVIEALKARAKTNSRSMEADVRDALTRLATETSPSGVEEVSRQRLSAARFSVPASDVMARLAANPPTDEERRVAAEWRDEYNARPHDEPEAWDDPWERGRTGRKDCPGA